MSGLAALLASCPDLGVRDATQSLEVAKIAVEFAPQSALSWQVLGWAHYRTGGYKASSEALAKSIQVQEDGADPNQWFFLAMAHWQLNQKNVARKWNDRAVAWMDENQATIKQNPHNMGRNDSLPKRSHRTARDQEKVIAET